MSLYTAVSPDEIHVGRQRLMSCISDLQEWCAFRRLQLNASKTELIWFGSRTSLRQLSLADSTLMIDSVVVQPSDVVRDLWVLLDGKLSLMQHVNRTASTCFYRLRRLRQLKRHVNVDVMKQLISAFVFSRLDYCNGILSGLPLATIAPLRRVQNAAARSCPWLVPERSHASCPEGVALVASGVPNQVQAGTGDIHNPHTSVPRLPD